jgi:MFS transporter, PAT family, beta-lactamase induction signal transducer AmpG
MEALDEHRQSMFVGIRSTFFRFALIFGQGILIIWAGNIESHTGPPPIPITITAAPAGVTPDPLPETTAPQTNLRLEPTNLALVAGTTATITARLMSAPETTISMNLYRKNKSVLSMLFPAGTEMKVRIDKGDRVSFGPDNWDKPQTIIVAADASLKQKVTVQFNATAGNVQLTYAICFAAMALLLLILGSYHAFALPAAEIHEISPSRAPFRIALGVIALVVAIPVAIFWGGYEGLYWIYEQVLKARPENLYKFLSILTVCALIWGTLMIPQIRKKLNSAMGFVANKTGFPFDEIFLSFFQKHGIGLMLGYLLLFRLGENMLTTMLAPFLTNPRSTGGMGLTTSEYGTAYGTIGIVLQVVGGIMGGIIIASIGLRKLMIPMCLILNVPHLLYLYLAATQPESRALIYACIGAETFCYGFAFTSYMVYMLYVAGQGKHKTSHFAICTGFMALGVTFPGMISGLIQELLRSWTSFYLVVFLAGIPGLLIIPFLPLEHGFGRKKQPA